MRIGNCWNATTQVTLVKGVILYEHDMGPMDSLKSNI